KERIASRLERIEASFGRRILRGTGVLATIGATAPFVGLFGTVWGIMNSFIGISKSHTTNLAVVAPGIAEALLATAFGLAAAIHRRDVGAADHLHGSGAACHRGHSRQLAGIDRRAATAAGKAALSHSKVRPHARARRGSRQPRSLAQHARCGGKGR